MVHTYYDDKTQQTWVVSSGHAVLTCVCIPFEGQKELEAFPGGSSVQLIKPMAETFDTSLLKEAPAVPYLLPAGIERFKKVLVLSRKTLLGSEIKGVVEAAKNVFKKRVLIAGAPGVTSEHGQVQHQRLDPDVQLGGPSGGVGKDAPGDNPGDAGVREIRVSGEGETPEATPSVRPSSYKKKGRRRGSGARVRSRVPEPSARESELQGKVRPPVQGLPQNLGRSKGVEKKGLVLRGSWDDVLPVWDRVRPLLEGHDIRVAMTIWNGDANITLFLRPRGVLRISGCSNFLEARAPGYDPRAAFIDYKGDPSEVALRYSHVPGDLHAIVVTKLPESGDSVSWSTF